MLKSYLTVAFRNLLKSRSFSLINILGLALGMAAFLLIVQYVVFERSFDQMHERGDRIFRVAMSVLEQGEQEQTFAFTYPAVAPAMRRDFPEVESAVRFRRNGRILRHGDKSFSELVYFADSTLFDIFSFPLISGDAHRALAEPYKGLVSESCARKYFGDADPLGQYLETEEGRRFEILGVFKDLPENSHIQFDILFSYITYVQLAREFGGDAEGSWHWSDFYTYILLQPGADVQALAAKMPDFASRYQREDMAANHYEQIYRLQPLREIHLHSDLGYELEVNGNARNVAFLTIVALFILFIAWFNYINLTTARSLDRAREVGVRKIVGAGRAELIRQFLLESLLLNGLALGLAILLVQTVFPAFRQLVGRDISLTLFQQGVFWLLAAALLVGGTLLAGLYPAFVLSGFRPISILKESLPGNWNKGAGLRRGLVAVQFAATIALLAGAFAVYQQLRYMRNQDLGINIEQTLILEDSANRDSSSREAVRAFQEELLRRPGIVGVTASGDIPGKEVGNSTGLRWVHSEDASVKRSRTFAVDFRFLDQYGMELLAGRKFQENLDAGVEPTPLILNETALRVFGISGAEAAIGEEISDGNTVQGRIVGVVRDYHQEALKFDFKPIVFYPVSSGFQYYSLRLKTGDLPGLMRFVEGQWKTRFPGTPFQSYFLDDFFNQQYVADRRFGQLFSAFSLLAIFVAALGLFGLSSFSVTRRTKEIGIRKVLGASVPQILGLLSREYIWLVLSASVVALPLAFWFIRQWLTNYAYHIDLGGWFFLAPVLAVLLIACLAVSHQSMRAALRNPVESLRYE